MSRQIRWLVLGLCIWGVTACSLPANTTPADPTATVEPTQTNSVPTATALPRLGEETLRNGTYDLPQYGKRVTLVDGNYQSGEGVERLMAVMQPQIAWGDLDGDGLEDAAVLIGENGGGSGVFVSLLVMLNQNGQAVQSGAVLIDDRPRIHSLVIQEGEIVVDAEVHSADDVMATPTLAVVEKYQLDAAGLVLTGLVSGVKAGYRHSIQIESPVPDTAVGGTVQLRGSMPIGPFENNLRLRLYDAAGNVFFEGPFGVKSADIGEPASFDNAVDLSKVASGSRIRIELAELSMKDGSVMTMDSVGVRIIE